MPPLSLGPLAKALDEMLGAQGMQIDHAINFAIPDDVLVERVTGRRSAPPLSLAPPCRDPPFPSEIGGWDDPAAGTGTGTCAGFVCAFATGCCVPRGPPGYPPIILGGGGPCGWGGAWAQGCGGYA